MSVLSTVQRLRAYQAGRAVPRTSHRQVTVQPHALVLCPLAMAGEDTALHAVAVGGIGQSPHIYVVADPRVRTEQHALFTWLADVVEPYFARCLQAGTYPQLWVSSTAGATLVDILADRLRYSTANPRAQLLGELLSYPAGRSPLAGQQALHAATGVLCLHWATGQDTGEDDHLHALLTWLYPPQGQALAQAVALAERIPAGVKTDPAFDRVTLGPLLDAYGVARRGAAPAAVLARHQRAIERALLPVLRPIYDATQRAVAIVQGMGRPSLPDLDVLDRREADAFASFMQSRAAGYHLALRDRPKAAAFGLAAREEAVENVDAAVRRGDAVARAEGALSGHVICGVVDAPHRLRLGPRRFDYRFDLLSAQHVLRARPRDILYWADDPRLCLEVLAVARRAGRTQLTLRVVAGQRAAGLPQAGTALELLPSIPDWARLARERGHLKARLASLPWTHTTGALPTVALTVALPGDPLAALEALR